MSDRNDEVRDLLQRAYHQGYFLGLGGHAAHAGDWEDQFRTAYLNGFNTGKLDRADQKEQQA